MNNKASLSYVPASHVLLTDGIADLLVAVAAKDQVAFRLLYSKTSDKVLGVLIRILGMRCEAEDALQEVFSRVWLKAGMYDAEKGRGMTWLISIARYHAIDKIRVRPRTVSDSAALDALIDTTPSAESCMIADGQAKQIHVCLDCLAPDRAAMLRGAYLDGQSYLDLAFRFDMPLNTVRTTLRRSLQKVRRCMEESSL